MPYKSGINREQVTIFPETLDDYITQDNEVQFIDAFVDHIEIEFKYSKASETGRPLYNPKDLLKLYLYGYINAIRSSRKLEKESHRNLEVMWLLKRLTPDHKTIANFRNDNKEEIPKVFKKVEAEISMIMLSYNIKRVMNIMGVRKLIEVLG